MAATSAEPRPAVAAGAPAVTAARRVGARAPRPRPDADAVVAALTALVLCIVAFGAGGGQSVTRAAPVELLLLLAGAGLGAAAIATGRGPRRLHGAGALIALGLLFALTAVSLIWSVAPAETWEEANRALAYVATFGAGMALARLAPGRWAGVLVGVAVASLAVTAHGVAGKALPALLAEDELYARLRGALGYWNAAGLMAALGVPPLLWLAARRRGNMVVNALAWPGLGLLLVGLLLSYSRGALLALVLGLLLWLALVPLRLRAAAALLGAAAVATIPIAYALSDDVLTTDAVGLGPRTDAGAVLGALVLLMLAALLALGLAVTFALARRAPSARARLWAGRVLVAGALALPLAGLVALAASEQGLTGRVSNAYEELVDPEAATPSNTPERLGETSSVRARYWREAFDIHAQRPWIGAGAGGFATARTRFRLGEIEVGHAHSYVVQTLADLGWTGLIVSALALAAWIAAAVRTLRRRGAHPGAEHVALATMATVVAIFVVHAAIDWTWSIPATACTALLLAGWIAARGPRTAATAPAPRRARVPRVAWAAALVALAAVGSWALVQPWVAARDADRALEAFDRGRLAEAAGLARDATRANPYAIDPLWDLAVIEHERGNRRDAEAALERAVEVQPARAEAWTRLGRYRMSALADTRGALPAFEAALFLDPYSKGAASDVIEARRALGIVE